MVELFGVEEVVPAVLGYGTFLVQLLLLLGLGVYVARKLGFQVPFEAAARDFISERYREIAFLQVLIATSGSLYMSNILGWTPCRLCWFQRIIIYPMVVLIGVAIFLDKEDVRDYVIPLAMIGIPISAYHYLIQRVEQFQSAGCSVLEVSCETTFSFYMGYISVPMMALTALVVVLVLMWRFHSSSSTES